MLVQVSWRASGWFPKRGQIAVGVKLETGQPASDRLVRPGSVQQPIYSEKHETRIEPRFKHLELLNISRSLFIQAVRTESASNLVLPGCFHWPGLDQFEEGRTAIGVNAQRRLGIN